MEDKKEIIGEIDDDYIILKKLSYGGQANVFLVENKNTNVKYAAKVPKKRILLFSKMNMKF